MAMAMRRPFDPNRPTDPQQRSNYDIQQETAQLDAAYQQNPSTVLPEGYHVENGHVQRNQPGYLLRDGHGWMIPALGIAAGLTGGAALSGLGGGGGAAGAYGAGAGATGAGIGASEGASAILPSTVIGTGAVPTVAGGTGLAAGAYGAGAGAATTAGTVAGSGGPGSSILSNGLRAAGPILSNITQQKQQSDQNNLNNSWRQEQLALAEPGIHLSDIAKANAMAAGPIVPHWGGPGSGLRGQVLSYSGGFMAPQDQATTDALNQFKQQQVGKLLNPDATNNLALDSSRSSTLDKILGGAGVGASVLGSILARR